MKFGLAVNLSVEIENKGDVIDSLSNDLKIFFLDKEYGEGIKSYYIGILCVSSKFDSFYDGKLRPKYTKGKKIIKLDGISYTSEDSFQYKLKLDYESFKSANDEDSKKLMAKAILESLVMFEKFKSKIKTFDFDSFNADLESYFKSQKLI